MERIVVTVHTTDPLSRDGVIRQLSFQPGIAVHEGRSTDGVPPAVGRSVAVMVVDRLDEERLVELRRLTRGGRRVVLVAGELREPELVAALECRVHGVLWRHEVTGDRLSAAVRSAASGGSSLPPELVGHLLDLLGRWRRGTASPGAGAFGLVAREVDVLRLVAEGLETRQIADKLAYSERTIKTVLHDLMTRLQLRNRAHAVAYALREGYI